MMRGLACDPEDDPAEAIRTWLVFRREEVMSFALASRQKTVILIDPPERRGEVVWDPR